MLEPLSSFMPGKCAAQRGAEILAGEVGGDHEGERDGAPAEAGKNPQRDDAGDVQVDRQKPRQRKFARTGTPEAKRYVQHQRARRHRHEHKPHRVILKREAERNLFQRGRKPAWEFSVACGRGSSSRAGCAAVGFAGLESPAHTELVG